MANLKLYPPYGTRDQSSSIKFEIENTNYDNIKIELENATDGVKIGVTHFEKIETGYGGVMGLNIPAQSSQLSISIFATLYKKDSEGNYEKFEICPAIFDITEDFELDRNIVVSPSFISQKDLCSIKIKGEPLSSSSFSVNDRIFRVIINEAGYGSIHFKGSEVVGNKELESLNKIPIYIYSGEHKTSKTFSGYYVNILPSDIAIHAGLDPRCDIASDHYVIPGTWAPPEDCDEVPCNPAIEICPCDPQVEDCPCNPDIEDCDECNPDVEDCARVVPEVPVVGYPVTPCENGEVPTIDHCRIHSSSAILLNNGMAMHAYLSPDITLKDLPVDEKYSVNRIFISAQKTSGEYKNIASGDVVVESKESDENFRIHVEEDMWNLVGAYDYNSLKKVFIVFYNGAFGYVKANVLGAEYDEYTGDFLIVADTGLSNVVLGQWIFCVNVVIFDSSTVASDSLYIATGSNSLALPYVRGVFETGDYVQPINVSIATNYKYRGVLKESYVYIVVEAITENNLSQLYFNSFSFGQDLTFTQESNGWVRITDETQGNNRNPIAKVDSYNNLYVIFDSDRGGINQVYYGGVGVNNTLFSASVFSSSIDKYAEFIASGDFPFDYFKPMLLKANVSEEYSPVPELDTEELLSEKLLITKSGDGNVVSTPTGRYLADMVFTSNPVHDEAIAIASLKIDSELENFVTASPSVANPLLQYNYQISFDLKATVTQTSSLTSETTVSDLDMDDLYTNWKSNFSSSGDMDSSVVSIDASVIGQPVYNGSNNNKFIIGRSDNNYDRIVPLVGSYNYTNTTDPSNVNSQIKILKDDNNLQDFTFGIMFEKTYFKATNIQTTASYVEDGNSITLYDQEMRETIYTGKAKLVVFIKTDEDTSDRAEYLIVREFPEELAIGTSANYDIITNYTRINSESTENVLNTYKAKYVDKFAGALTLLIDGVPKFSQSFVSTLDLTYNHFDIGFGIPKGGYYISDKMAPSKLGVFDDVTTTLDISNISISSPTYIYNDAVVGLSLSVRDMSKLRVYEKAAVITPSGASTYLDANDNELINLGSFGNNAIKYFTLFDTDVSEHYDETFSTVGIEVVSFKWTTSGVAARLVVQDASGGNLHDTGFVTHKADSPLQFDIDVSLLDSIQILLTPTVSVGLANSYDYIAYYKATNEASSFNQIPITSAGVNQSPSLDLGICDDLHIAWQSNSSKSWDIYYTNSVNELSPFRHKTQITNTESNSIRPAVSVNRNGKRMIAWNDNRDGNFSIYSARSTEGYDCNQNACGIKQLNNHEDSVDICSTDFTFTPTETGTYDLVAYFYSDIENKTLYKTITLEGNESRWYLDGIAVDLLATYDAEGSLVGIDLIQGSSYAIKYVPDKDDKIFDIILYVKMDTVLTVEGV